MSPSLSLDADRIDQPVARDAIDRATWADIRISAGSRSVSRLLDRATQTERSTLYLPAFPLVEWMVGNWWTMLYEACLNESVPPAFRLLRADEMQWLKRHCLRAADPGAMLPRMCLYGDGVNLCVQWTADDPGAHAHMPGEFVTSGLVRLPIEDGENGLRGFVTTVIDWLRDLHDPRVVAVRENWQAILQASGTELEFCRAAGRLGLDPYALEEWPPGLAEFLEQELPQDDRQAVRDLLDACAANPDVSPSAWRWASAVVAEHRMDRRAALRTLTREEAPYLRGYRVAQEVRSELRLAERFRIDDVAQLPDDLGAGRMAVVGTAGIPARSIQGAVGWVGGRTPVLAGRIPGDERERRFFEARGLFHALFACNSGPRLVTSAHTWDQQAARAFAAELLAPQAQLVVEWQPDLPPDEMPGEIDRLANHFAVSPRVIRHQLENAGLSVEVA